LRHEEAIASLFQQGLAFYNFFIPLIRFREKSRRGKGRRKIDGMGKCSLREE